MLSILLALALPHWPIGPWVGPIHLGESLREVQTVLGPGTPASCYGGKASLCNRAVCYRDGYLTVVLTFDGGLGIVAIDEGKHMKVPCAPLPAKHRVATWRWEGFPILLLPPRAVRGWKTYDYGADGAYYEHGEFGVTFVTTPGRYHALFGAE